MQAVSCGSEEGAEAFSHPFSSDPLLLLRGQERAEGARRLLHPSLPFPLLSHRPNSLSEWIKINWIRGTLFLNECLIHRWLSVSTYLIQFNSPECPCIKKPWTSPRWNLSSMPKMAGEIPNLRKFGAPDDLRRMWGTAATYFLKILWRLPCENPFALVSRKVWWLQQGSESQKATDAGTGSCSDLSFCISRAHSSSWRQHHEQTAVFCPHCFQLQ